MGHQLFFNVIFDVIYNIVDICCTYVNLCRRKYT